jgi:methyl-accepting chemotaxis protein
MKHSVFKFITILLFIVASSLPVVTSTHAKAEEASEETKQTNCCEKMELMNKQMKPMMENHKMVMNNMKSLFEELQKGGNLTQAQIKEIKNIEKMMIQMEEKMAQMSSIKVEE